MGENYLLKLFIFFTFFIGVQSLSFAQNQYYLDFDGSNDYIRYADDATLGRLDGASNYTIEAWIYLPSGANTGGRIVQRYSLFLLYYGTSNNRLSFGVDKDGKNWEYYHSTNNALPDDDAWHHVAAIRNTSAGTFKLYVDGVDVSSGTWSGKALRNEANRNLYIGQDGGGSHYFEGSIDEVRLKNVAENPLNLHYHIYDNQYSSDANTAGLFHFNEGAGNTVNTASGTSARNGSTTGADSGDPLWRAWNYHANNILPLSKNTWDGSSSTDWATATNWSMNAIPTSESYVVITNVTNQPTIAAAAVENCGNITVEASAILTIAGTLNIAGDFTNNGSFTASGSSSIIFNGDDEQNIAAGTYFNLKLDNSSAANCRFDGSTTISGTLYMDCDITIANGDILDCNGTVTSDDDCIISNNGTIKIGGTFTQAGAYSNTAGLVVFDGAASQTIPSDDFYNVTIDNSNGVTLDGAVSVEGTLTLTNGIITTTTTKLLTINDGGSVSGSSNTAHVDGPIAKVGAGDFVFPTGDGGKWARVGISGLSSSETFTVEYHKATPANNTSMASPLTKVSDNEWWQIDRAGSATADITYYWEDSKWSGIGNFSDLRLAHWNSTSSEWEEVSGTYTNTGSVDLSSVQSGTLKVTGVSSFSPFAPATIDNTTNTLPIELISFDLVKNENKTITLNWATASETNNSGFELQRSTDAEHWNNIAFVNGAGNSNELLSYSFVDQQPNMANYYRLKQIDYDGAYSYSNIRYALFSNENKIKIYPNPVANTLYISGLNIDNTERISLYNYMGKLIREYDADATTISTEGLNKGVYFIRIQYQNMETESKQFIKL